MATGTNRSPRTSDAESRVARLHRGAESGGSLTLQPGLDDGREVKTVLVFGAMIAVAAVLLLSLVIYGGLAVDSNAGLMLAFALGIIVTCALSSSLAFLITLRHKLLLLILASLAVIIASIAADMGALEAITKVIFATSAGLWISLMLTSITQVVLIASLIIVVDFYSVFLGPTKKIVESGSAWIDYLTIHLPVFGAPAVSQIGISDIIFFALFVGVTISYGLRRVITACAMTLSFVATMVLGVSFELGVPALPLLAISFMLANADIIFRRYLHEPGGRGGRLSD